MSNVRSHSMHRATSKFLKPLLALLLLLSGCATQTPSGAPLPTSPPAATQSTTAGNGPRNIEDIAAVFEQNKVAFYAAYNRALRENPNLKGTLIFELKISPLGEVLECRIISSTLGAPELEQRLVNRIKNFDFGANQGSDAVIRYPVQFFPS